MGAANFGTSLGDELTCSGNADHPGDSYRHGCTAVIAVPKIRMSNSQWALLGCAERNQLTVTQYSMDLGTLRAGATIHHAMTEDALPKGIGSAPH